MPLLGSLLTDTVPVDEPPPATVPGLKVRPARGTGSIVRSALSVCVPSRAVTVAVSGALMFRGLIVKVPTVCPASTVTTAGTSAAALLLLDRLMISPPGGAGLSSVIVPTDGVPAATVVGLRVRDSG